MDNQQASRAQPRSLVQIARAEVEKRDQPEQNGSSARLRGRIDDRATRDSGQSVVELIRHLLRQPSNEVRSHTIGLVGRLDAPEQLALSQRKQVALAPDV